MEIALCPTCLKARKKVAEKKRLSMLHRGKIPKDCVYENPAVAEVMRRMDGTGKTSHD